MSRVRSNNHIATYLVELRRSNAAGIHDHKPTRSQQNREAIEMSLSDMDYPGAANVEYDREPTDAELRDAEEEYQNLHLGSADEEDWEKFYRLNTGYEDYGDPYDDEYDMF